METLAPHADRSHQCRHGRLWVTCQAPSCRAAYLETLDFDQAYDAYKDDEGGHPLYGGSRR
jgi:hypothetical protein